MENKLALTEFDTMMLGTGLLGAVSPAAHGHKALEHERLLMIERRILGIEAALRRSGIEVEPPDEFIVIPRMT